MNPIDKTFDRLRRVSYEQLVESVARNVFSSVTEKDINLVINVFSSTALTSAPPEQAEFYASQGWEWADIIEESRKRRNDKVE